MNAIEKRNEICRLLGTGLRQSEISKIVGLSKSTVSWHCRKVGMPVSLKRQSKKHLIGRAQELCNAGVSPKKIRDDIGVSKSTWFKWAREGKLFLGNGKIKTDDMLTVNSDSHRGTVKHRLIAEGRVKEACFECGITSWQGRKLSLVLDHINGINNDNRIENLRLLCPNCNSQTDTFAGRNIGRLKRIDAGSSNRQENRP